MKLANWQKNILQKISDLTLKTPESAILLGINAKASQYLQLARISIQSPEDNAITPCNFYAILFMPSGSGKDRLLSLIQDNFFNDCKQFFVAKSQHYILDAKEDLEQKLAELQTKAAKELYRQMHEPRYLSLVSSDGTPEGLLADREAYAIAGFGGTFFQNSEFVNYLKAKDQTKEYFLSLIGEIFDKGNSNPKTIKGNKKAMAIEGVPNTMFVHSSLADVHRSGIFEQILESLNRQLARRSFICFPDENEYRKIPDSVEELEKQFSKSIDKEFCKNESLRLKNIVEKLCHEPHIIYKLDDNAKKLYFEYFLNCQKRAENFNQFTKDGLIAEVLGRSWKMLKLAGIIHSFKYDFYNEYVSSETIEEAISQTEFYGKYYEKFYSHSAPDELMQLYEWLKTRINEQILKTEIRAMKFVNVNKFTRWFDENLETIKDLAMQDGLIFEELSGKGNIKAYILRKI